MWFLLFTNLGQGLWGRSPTLSRKILAWERLEAEIIYSSIHCIWNRKNHNNIALIWMYQDNIQTGNSLWEKRNSPRPDSGGVMWRDLSLDLGSFSFAIFCSFHSIYHHHPHPWDDSSPSKYCFTKNKLNYLGEKVNLVSLKMICLIVPSNHCIAEFHQLLRISEETRFGQSEWI